MDIVRRAVLHYRDESLWEAAAKLERKGRDTLHVIHSEFGDVCSFLKEKIQSRNEIKMEMPNE